MKETIFALTAILIALMWSAWDFIVYTWWTMTVRQRWCWLIIFLIVFGLAFWRGVVPVVWEYVNLVLSLF
jgi:hypothetical protein